METKNIRMIFKFREDLLIHRELIGIENFSFSNPYMNKDYADEYYSEAVDFFKVLGLPPLMLTKNMDLKFETLKVKFIYSRLVKFANILQSRNLKIHYLFDVIPIDVVNKLTLQIQNRHKNKSYHFNITKLINFYNYFVVELPNYNWDDKNKPKEFDDLLNLFEEFLPYKNFKKRHLLDFVYLKSEAQLPDILIGDSSANQNYFSTMDIWDTGVGGGVTYQNSNNAKGENITILDIEKKWNINHTEFNTLPIISNSLVFPNTTDSGYTVNDFTNDGTSVGGHGTGILGVLKSNHTSGVDLCKGITPNSTIKLSSVFYKRNAGNEYASEENALLSSIFDLEGNQILPIGSIILIELYATPYPLEIEPAIYQIIRYLAIPLSLIVVEPSGQGGSGENISNISPNKVKNVIGRSQLYRESIYGKSFWGAYTKIEGRLQRLSAGSAVLSGSNSTSKKTNFITQFLRTESGAILVGAYKDGYFKADASNYGIGRVKIFAQGEGIKTTNVDGTTYDITTATSGASAIIAGICASLQGIAKANGKLITPQKMLEYLSTYGTDVQMSNTDNTIVGKIPDYQQAVSQLLYDIQNNVI